LNRVCLVLRQTPFLQVARQRGFSMTEYHWLSLRSLADIQSELSVVAQPRKLFLLGTEFLRRVWDLLPSDATRDAVETTESFARGRCQARDMLEMWSRDELSTEEGVWVGRDYHRWECDCCEDMRADALNRALEEAGIHPGTRALAREPARFAATAAEYARDLAGSAAPPGEDKAARSAEQAAQFALVWDIIGDPLDAARPAPPEARQPEVRRLLTAVADRERIEPIDMLALADSLEEAGCARAALLDHLRRKGPHGPGCWAIEELLGRAVLSASVDDSPRVVRRRR
jgi:hypothetical protein